MKTVTASSAGRPATPIELVCLDMAGTTVADDGAVAAAFAAALDELGVAAGAERRRMNAYVRDTMGTSKIEVFRALFDGEQRARSANEAFEAAYDATVRRAGVRPLPGALECLEALRAGGLRIALTTGFSPRTRELVVSSLGWGPLVDLALSPADAGRGRPFPDMVLTALVRLGVSSVGAVAVVGDTRADMECGRRAGASVVAGVLTGADDRARLEAAGATVVVDSVGSLPALVGLG
ncbi:MAG: HAD family hydrolase [Acidimicrobiales bacterium]